MKKRIQEKKKIRKEIEKKSKAGFCIVRRSTDRRACRSPDRRMKPENPAEKIQCSRPLLEF